MAAAPNPRMAKIVICCDGTSNSEFLDGNPITNVTRISRLIRPFDDQGHRQIVLYLPGIGTDSWNPMQWAKQAAGKGLDDLILEAYTFICHNYTAEYDDQIMLIGFSRGAFAMRCLADFILDRGLLAKTSLYLLPALFRKWKSRQPNGDDIDGTDHTDVNEPDDMDADDMEHLDARGPGLLRAVTVDERRNRQPTRIIKPVNIRVCALWDTVASINFPLPGLGWVHSAPPAGVEHIYQALSLHERRYYFFPIVMKRPVIGAIPPLQQCWFSGYHGDVGGGNEKEVLAHFTLAWMISRLQGLLTFEEKTFWYWSNNKPTWLLPPRKKWGIPLPWSTDKISVPDTLTASWRPLGTRYRHPRLQFWNDNGLDPVGPGELGNEPDSPGDESKERIHETVRFLTDEEAFPQCSSLRDIEPEQDGLHWFWKLRVPEEFLAWWRRLWRWLRRQGIRDADYRVWEQRLDEPQKKMLRRWLKGEHRRLYAANQAGDETPSTIIVPFTSWIGNPLVNGAPTQSLPGF